MRKHISEVDICAMNHGLAYMMSRDSCENYHKGDFCLFCGYELEGDRLYMEIHGDDGALDRTMDIDSSQPYACMECVGQFRAYHKIYGTNRMSSEIELHHFIKERKL